jgi:tripartite-type tricarboxylate transporter receptor subunit TctC
MRLKAIIVLTAAILACITSTKAEEPYPSRLITVISPLAAGTTGDFLARLYADKLSQRLGQSIVVSNRPGAGGVIGAQAVAGAPPDGYTLLLANSGHSSLGTLNKHLPFDPLQSFSGVELIGEAPALVVVSPSLNVHTLQEFVDLAKAKPGTINYASAGIGSATHLAGAYFAKQAGIDIVHVPYKSSADIIADLIAGRVQVVFAPAAFTLPFLKGGKLVALAVAASSPMHDPIDVPSTTSANVSYEYATWYGFLAPANTPESVLQTLHQAIVEVSADQELKAKVVGQGITPKNVGLREFDAHMRNEMERLAPLLKSIGEQIDN